MTFGVSRAGRDVAIEWRLVGAPHPAATVPAPIATRDADPAIAEITAQITSADDTHYTITRAALKKTLEGGGLPEGTEVFPDLAAVAEALVQ